MKKKAGTASDVIEDDDIEETKIENAEKKEFDKILKFLRTSVPTKTAQIKKEKVQYITGAKLLDALMASQWGPSATKSDSTLVQFTTRSDAAKYCKKLFECHYLVGGKKIEMGAEKKEETEEEDYTESKGSPRSKKKVRRFRIDWSPNVKEIKDSSDEIYIWQYEVPQRYTFILGLVILVAIIGFTLQPLWPDSSKMGMWFLSVIMMVLLGLLLALYIVRWFVWALLYTLSGGKVVFWLLPNLDDEKLGVIDSFKPFYSLKFKKKKKKSSQQTENQDDNAKPTEDEVTELDKPVLQDEKGKKKRKTAKQQVQDKEEIVLEKQDNDNEISSKVKKKKAKQTPEEHESVDTRTKKEN